MHSIVYDDIVQRIDDRSNALDLAKDAASW